MIVLVPSYGHISNLREFPESPFTNYAHRSLRFANSNEAGVIVRKWCTPLPSHLSHNPKLDIAKRNTFGRVIQVVDSGASEPGRPQTVKNFDRLEYQDRNGALFAVPVAFSTNSVFVEPAHAEIKRNSTHSDGGIKDVDSTKINELKLNMKCYLVE